MDNDKIKSITETALLLALTVVLQGLRLFLPLPAAVSLFLIGSLVNACLVVAVLRINAAAGYMTACITPVFAWVEGMLPFFPFIFPVACGNCAFVFAVALLKNSGLKILYVSAFIKMLVLCGAFFLLFSCVSFPETVRQAIFFAMSWPQLVTGIAGITLAWFLQRRTGCGC
ncbi:MULTISPECIES: hypothetical protein [Megasphaera]|uniref:ECF transporter S component n=1 Tax=Megasphaera vaginalis (ex Srinivasan et al. 2021) TaxID=1111454 RepID=U7US09_9FIRM|nr:MULTISPECIES: hypothetical protein [Megasphaera]ERT61664.1 hypothetical protein HMPREF1250_2259 [Megasphaera vaginalis (ex Srinivasan et al. 2021)]